MTRSLLRWNLAFGLLLLSVIAIPVFSQKTRDEPDDRRDVEDVVRTMEQQGQLRLAGAIEIAERHAKGRAVRASVEISRERREREDSEKRDSKRDDDDQNSKRNKNDKQGESTRKDADVNPDKGKGVEDKTQDKRDSGGAGVQSQATGDLPLIYEVMCFARGEIQAVRIDGKSRKVISGESRSTLDPLDEDDMEEEEEAEDDDSSRKDNDRRENGNDNDRRDDRDDDDKDQNEKDDDEDVKSPAKRDDSNAPNKDNGDDKNPE